MPPRTLHQRLWYSQTGAIAKRISSLLGTVQSRPAPSSFRDDNELHDLRSQRLQQSKSRDLEEGHKKREALFAQDTSLPLAGRAIVDPVQNRSHLVEPEQRGQVRRGLSRQAQFAPLIDINSVEDGPASYCRRQLGNDAANRRRNRRNCCRDYEERARTEAADGFRACLGSRSGYGCYLTNRLSIENFSGAWMRSFEKSGCNGFSR